MTALSYQGPNGWSVVTSVAVVCFNVSHAEAKAAALAAGVEMVETDAATFRSTLTSALALSTQGLDGEVQALVESVERDRLTAKVEALMGVVVAIHEEIQTANRLAEDAAAREAAAHAAQLAEGERLEALAKKREQQAKANAAAAAKLAAKQLDRRAMRFDDGSVDVTTRGDGKYRVVVARYAPGETLPPDVEALL